MLFTSLSPIIAATAFLLFALYISFKGEAKIKGAWIFPTVLSLLFFVFSLETIVTEGLLGFWTEHTRNLWGNQIWFDLLLLASIGWFFVVPQAKSLGMRLLLWLVLIAGTGSIGFLAMVARFLYLREKAGKLL
jgi:hypothetical protein